MAETPVHNRPRTDAKYLHLVDHLASQIRSGELAVGDRLPTFVELQAAFKLTSPTVNRAMITLEQQGLVERRRGSGVYVLAPRPQAPSVVPGTAGPSARPSEVRRGARGATIGLAGFGFQLMGQSSYWTALLSGVREVAGRSGGQIMLLDHESSAGWEKADGILVCDWTQKQTLQHIPPSLPCVSMLVAAEGLASVVADDYQGGRCATEHLLQLGHRRIAYLHGPDFTSTARRRVGYHDALLAAGVTPEPEWERLLLWKHGHYEDYVQAGVVSMARWLRAGWKSAGCTALLCQNDATAVGAAQALRKAGYSVPEDVSLVGYDGCEIGSYLTPSLTTVQLPLREIGANAMRILNGQIENDVITAEHVVLAPQLQVRESTTAPFNSAAPRRVRRKK